MWINPRQDPPPRSRIVIAASRGSTSAQSPSLSYPPIAPRRAAAVCAPVVRCRQLRCKFNQCRLSPLRRGDPSVRRTAGDLDNMRGSRIARLGNRSFDPTSSRGAFVPCSERGVDGHAARAWRRRCGCRRGVPPELPGDDHRLHHCGHRRREHGARHRSATGLRPRQAGFAEGSRRRTAPSSRLTARSSRRLRSKRGSSRSKS